ncbi:hypothetical protein [uncultured Chitinophaga sp.]|uniref:hypothetical protein n=1 Tax=uncultured Chitinophaga sp. TaxID=339340 RepID=UPI0025E43C20|nr:hypothetical protein [uncultured Chitinophaga sp.]
MTIRDINALLCSRSYYDITGDKKFRFDGNSMYIDRKAGMAYSLHEADGRFYLDTDPSLVADEESLRIEVGNSEGPALLFYGSQSGREVLVLE